VKLLDSEKRYIVAASHEATAGQTVTTVCLFVCLSVCLSL